ncbi:MAG: type II toxin-antitoxin system RelE/ParE family toxin [Chlamydiales bacterium]
MIQSFADEGTEDIYHGINSGKARRTLPHNLVRIAMRKLDSLDAATRLDDLRIPPSNHLEALSKDLKGYHSIRINDQYRIVFKWTQTGIEEVKISDYH